MSLECVSLHSFDQSYEQILDSRLSFAESLEMWMASR